MEISFWRLPAVIENQGLRKSAIHARIQCGLFPRPIQLGGKAVAWLPAEIQAVNAARVAGKSNDEIRALVRRLETDRLKAAA